jgi:hypothetical protein
MEKQMSERRSKRKTKSQVLSYRIKCKRTANGLSHYVPAEKKALV